MHESQVALLRTRDKPIGASPTNLGNMHPTVSDYTHLHPYTRIESARHAPELGATAEYSHHPCTEGRQAWEKSSTAAPRWWLLTGLPPLAGSVTDRGLSCAIPSDIRFVGSRRLPQIFPAEYLDLVDYFSRDQLVV